jgi:adenosylhomocysteinase
MSYYNKIKLEEIIEPFSRDYAKKVESFYEKILDKNKDLDLSLIVVSLLVPDRIPFCRTLQKKGYNVAGFVPKGIRRDKETVFVKELRKEGIEISLEIDKTRLLDEQSAFEYVQSVVSTSRYAILDMGGYFAASAPFLSKRNQLKTLVGIIEDTENGHKKYERVMNKISCPVFSIARNPIKEAEDANIGADIFQATESFLKSEMFFSSLCIDYAGVIGLGKIGRSIAHTLRGNRVQMFCYDQDPLVMAQMKTKENFPLATKNQVLSQCNIIFSATGNNAITKDDLYRLKDNTFIATVTSPDDELGFDPQDLTLVRSTENIKTYEVGNGNHIHLICDGYPPNILFGALPGPGLFLSQSGILTSLNELQNNQYNSTEVIHTLSRDKLYKSSETWLEYFANIIGR